MSRQESKRRRERRRMMRHDTAEEARDLVFEAERLAGLSVVCRPPTEDEIMLYSGLACETLHLDRAKWLAASRASPKRQTRPDRQLDDQGG